MTLAALREALLRSNLKKRSPRFARDDNSKTVGILEKALFFLVIFCLPFQVGLHFWFDFSYINGVRIDYLSPTLYLLDVLISIWCGIALIRGTRVIGDIRVGSITKALIALFVLDLLSNVFFAKSPGAHVFGLVKLVELGVFGWLIARSFKKQDIPFFVRTLSLSAILPSILAIWQFINQSSVGGLWYFLGERTFNLSTIGISTVNLDHQLLRAYSTFSHPNVLAFFLLMVITFVSMQISNEKNKKYKALYLLSIGLSLIALLLTFSRMSIALTIGLVAYAIYAKGNRNIGYFVGGIVTVILAAGIYLLLITQPTFLLRGIDFREELLLQSLSIFQRAPYFGIGLNNFFIHQADLIKTISPINFQPPHNMLVLAFLELGLFGWWIVPVGFIRAVREAWGKIQTKDRVIKAFYQSVLFLLVSIVVVGMFDHFFLTVEQGQIMLALILGLSFIKPKV